MNFFRILVLLLLLIAGCTSQNDTAPIVDTPLDPLPAPMSWPSFDEAIATAARTGMPMLIDIYSPLCGWCRKMQQDVYTDAALVGYVQGHFAYGRLNIDDSETLHEFLGHSISSQELSYSLGADGTPTTVFLTSDGTYIAKCGGYWGKEEFRTALSYVATGAWKQSTYEEYSRF